MWPRLPHLEALPTLGCGLCEVRACIISTAEPVQVGARSGRACASPPSSHRSRARGGVALGGRTAQCQHGSQPCASCPSTSPSAVGFLLPPTPTNLPQQCPGRTKCFLPLVTCGQGHCSSLAPAVCVTFTPGWCTRSRSSSLMGSAPTWQPPFLIPSHDLPSSLRFVFFVFLLSGRLHLVSNTFLWLFSFPCNDCEMLDWVPHRPRQLWALPGGPPVGADILTFGGEHGSGMHRGRDPRGHRSNAYPLCRWED